MGAFPIMLEDTMDDDAEMLKARLDRMHNDLQVEQQNLRAAHQGQTEIVAELNARLDAMQANLDQAALANSMEPQLALDARLAQYEPLVNNMLRDIRVARDHREKLEAELTRVHREKEVAIRRMVGLGEANEPAVMALREANVEGTKSIVRQLADQHDEIETLRAELVKCNDDRTRMMAAIDKHDQAMAVMESEFQHVMDEKRAVEAQLGPAIAVIALVQHMLDTSEIGSALDNTTRLVELIRKYEIAGI